MVRISFFSPNIAPLILCDSEGYGGAELDLLNIARKLSENKGYEVNIITITNEIQVPTVFFKKILVIPVTPYEQGKKRRGHWLKYMARLVRALWSNHSDIYFLKLASLETVIAFWVARLKGKKIIYRMAHDWETDSQNLEKKIFSNRSWLAKLFIFSLKRVDLVISQTNKQAELLQKNFNINSTTISNAHYIPELSEESKSSILWVGRAHPMKRPEVLLALAKSFKNEKFVMVMSPNKDYDHIYRDIKEKSSEINNLNFVGGVRHKDIDKYYRKARIFVLTSDTEGQSNVLIEALKSRTPIISLSVDPDGILMNNKLGFCADGNFDKMKKYMNTMLEDDKMWQQYSDRAYKFAKENFDIEKTATEYEEILKML